MEKYKVLFVCLGNICRSPAAEAILKEKLKERNLLDKVYVDSAGTSGYNVGDMPDNRMRAHGRRRGYEIDSISRKLTSKDILSFDLILVMDDQNFDNTISLCLDDDSEKKVYRVADFLKKYQQDHIPDPYYSGADGFELVLDLLDDACNGILDYIKGKIKI